VTRARAALFAALAAGAALFVLAERAVGAATGARLDSPSGQYRVAGIELPRHGQQYLPWRDLSARFVGFVQLDAGGPREWRIVANGHAVLRLDGRQVPERAAEAEAPAARATLDLPPGSHALELEYSRSEGPHLLRLLLSEPGGAPERLSGERLFPDPPSAETIARVERARGARGAGLLLLVVAGAGLLATLLRGLRWRTLASWQPALPLLLIGFAGLLRLEALVHAQWQERAPPVLRSLAVAMWDLHPAALRPKGGAPGYEGDPFTYLRFAREMRGFYDAHVREPVFVATARGFLELLAGDDAGLALASACYSTLLVAATYLLGTSFFSPAVGLLAALPLALERQSVAFSALGWRDDAFAFFTALTLVALRRLLDRPGFGSGLLCGACAALACLTRITALSFVLPCLALAAWSSRRERPRATWRALGLASGLMLALLLPYLLACWIAFGDPLVSINAHTVFYRAGAGLPSHAPMSAGRFLFYERGPLALADTGLVGVTSYPFLNKWSDFDDWLPGAAWLFSLAAVLGLLSFCFLSRARLLLLALATSLLPYAFTWELPGGGEWRFTLHAYPFYLVAAAWALTAPFRRADRLLLPRALLAGLLALPFAWLAASGLHYLRIREDLRAGKPALVAAGPRDSFLFSRGWGGLRRFDNGYARRAGPGPALVRLPLAGGAYRLTLRARPAPGCPAPCLVEVALEGRPLLRRATAGEGMSDRFGVIEVPLAAAQARGGASLLELRGGPFELWQARVETQPR
jgi:hypothetical protein